MTWPVSEETDSVSLPLPAVELSGTAVDLAVLAAYGAIQIAGEPDLVIELIDLYVIDAPRRVGLMRELLAQGNWPEVTRQAHSLRGSSGSLGALQTLLICDVIEATAAGELFPSQTALLSSLENELARVIQALLAERLRRSP